LLCSHSPQRSIKDPRTIHCPLKQDIQTNLLGSLYGIIKGLRAVLAPKRALGCPLSRPHLGRDGQKACRLSVTKAN